MATTNRLHFLQSLAQRIENVYYNFKWGKRKHGKPDVVFDKQTCCNPPLNAPHDTWWAYVQPRNYPRVTGYGKTLQEALQILHDQLILGPPQSTTNVSNLDYWTRAVNDMVRMQNQNLKIATKLNVAVPTTLQSHNSGFGNHTLISVAPLSVQWHNVEPAPQPVTTSNIKQIPERIEKPAAQSTSLKDTKITFSALGTAAALATIQASKLGSSDHAKPTVSTVSGLMNSFTVKRRAQSEVMTTTSTLRMPEVSGSPAITVSPFASLTPNSFAPFGRSVGSKETVAGENHERPKMTFDESKCQWKSEDTRDQNQQHSGLLRAYAYQDPKSKINNPKPQNFASPTNPFASLVSSIGGTFTSPRPSPQNMLPAHASGASGLTSTKALFPSLQSSKTAGYFPRPLQTKVDASHLPANSMSTMVSTSEPGKRKRDDTSYGASNSDAEQQVQKKIKIEEEPQTIQVEEQSPKKIKLEELN